MPEPGVVPQSSRGDGRYRKLAPSLQYPAPSFEPALPDADRVPTASRVHQPGSRSQVTNGPRIPGQVRLAWLRYPSGSPQRAREPPMAYELEDLCRDCREILGRGSG